VERLQGALDQANTSVAQLQEQLQAATSARKNAEALLDASESELDEQTREKIEQARGARIQVATAVDFAKVELDRAREQLKSGIISQQQLDLTQAKYDSAAAQLQQADASVRQAEQSLGSGSSRIQSAREQVQSAAAREREVRLELESQSAGMNPEVRQILADLQNKQFDLDSTTVKAPADGMPVQVFVRPGQMATALGALPTMIFVQGDKPELIASFPQNTVQYMHPGLEAELAFKMYPGQIFKAKVRSIATITPEGQFIPSGQVRNVSPATSTYIPVVFDYGPEIEALNLPYGAQVGVAVYTENIHAISIVRKIILRMKSWENYLFSISLGH
jgi:multidrug resistance efflux pump